MKVAVFQMDIVWENPQWNLDKVSNWARGLESDVELVVLPEMFATGFSMNPSSIAQTDTGEIVLFMTNLAIEVGKAFIFSAAIKSVNQKGVEKFYNRLYFIGPDGVRMVYDKRHLFRMAGEHNFYSDGEQQLFVHYKGLKIMPLICYDLRFPIWSRAANSCDILIYIASWPEARRYAWDTLLRARAIENQCYVLGVNRCGDDPKNHYVGSSVVLDFMGKPIAMAEDNMECGVVCDVDKAAIDEFRKGFPAQMDADKYSIQIEE